MVATRFISITLGLAFRIAKHIVLFVDMPPSENRLKYIHIIERSRVTAEDYLTVASVVVARKRNSDVLSYSWVNPVKSFRRISSKSIET